MSSWSMEFKTTNLDTQWECIRAIFTKIKSIFNTLLVGGLVIYLFGHMNILIDKVLCIWTYVIMCLKVIFCIGCVGKLRKRGTCHYED